MRQLVHADKILINKVDQIGDSLEKDKTLKDIKECIKYVNKHALVQETTFAEASLDFLLEKPEGNGTVNKEELMEKNTALLKDNHRLSHQIVDEVKSVYINMEEGVRFNKDKLEMFIGELIWEGP